MSKAVIQHLFVILTIKMKTAPSFLLGCDCIPCSEWVRLDFVFGVGWGSLNRGGEHRILTMKQAKRFDLEYLYYRVLPERLGIPVLLTCKPNWKKRRRNRKVSDEKK